MDLKRLNRRQFLGLLGGSAAGAVIFQACGVPEDELLVEAPLQMPEDLVTGVDNWYATLCRQCPTSEGIVVRVIEGRAKKVEGNVDYPINMGKHSARCEAGLQSLYDPDRISGPLLRTGERGEGQWEEISWTDAITRLAHQLNEASDPGQVVMVTEPVGAHLGMVVERFAERYGARHIPYETLERTTLRASMQQVFGLERMPDFDIENASYLLSFGADFLNTWVSPVRYARGYGQFRQGERERGTFVQVDSRLSMSAANADEWIYVNPGREGLLALSIAQVIVSDPSLRKLADEDGIRALTDGDDGRLDAFAPDRVAASISSAVSQERMAETIRRTASDFVHHQPSLAIGGGPAAAHTNGLFNMNAVYSLNRLVGNVGKPGGVTPNPPSPLADVPSAPASASYEQWRSLAGDMNAGRVRALLVHGADPMYGLPEAVGLREASYKVPFIFSFSSWMDDTTAMADLVLPSHSHLEDWGSDVPDPGPGHQVVGYQQPVVRPLFEPRGVHLGTKGFGDVLLSLAQLLELDLELSGSTFMDVVKESSRQLMGRGSEPFLGYSSFPAFWNGLLRHGGWWDTGAKHAGAVPAPAPLPTETESPRFSGPEGSNTFYLAPFASASLTDGRGAHLPWLQATPDPVSTATWRTWAEINLNKAREMDIEEGDVVVLETAHGSIEALAYPHPGISPEVVAVPIGQGHRAGGRYAEGRGANVLSILSPDLTDGAGSLAWAANRVKVTKTDRWERLPKMENSKPDLATDEHRLIIPLATRDT